MKNIRAIEWFVAIALFIASGSLLFSSGGEDHQHGEEQAGSNQAGENFFSLEAFSEKYELLLRYDPVKPGEQTRMKLFISEFSSNKPIDKAELKISAREDDAIAFHASQTGEGEYELETTFPELKKYSLTIQVNASQGADLFLLESVEVGRVLAAPGETVQPGIWNWKIWFLLFLALFLGLGSGMWVQKKFQTRSKRLNSIVLAFIVCILPVSQGSAHGDDDHGAKKPGNPFANEFRVPKETQFLFDVFTGKFQSGNFAESTKLFGTILPGRDGHAVVSAPWAGKILSLPVRVGQHVNTGELLAVIEQSIDAASQISLLAEKNNALAERKAAEAIYKNLLSIKDIAAGKDLEEAAARLQKAESQVRLFESKGGTTLSLYSPIQGTLGNFTLSLGSTVDASQDLFAITDLGTVYVEAQVFDRDVNRIVKGAKYVVECSNDNHKTGEVQVLSISQKINPSNQSQQVLFEMKNPGSDFKIGEFVNIRVFEAEESGKLALPNSAIVDINGKPLVFIKNSAERFSVSYVQLGANNGGFTTILKGVGEGERVATNGSYQLKMIYLNQ